MAIILSDQEVRTLVNPEDMLTSIESMQKQFGKGNAGNLPRRKIISDRGMLAVMGGALFYDDVATRKTRIRILDEAVYRDTLSFF